MNQDQPADTNTFTALRRPQLQKLSREHEACLRFAVEIAAITKQNNEAALLDGIRRIREYNDQEMEAHLQHEEQTILGPLIQCHPDHRDLCITLGQEHGLLRTLVEAITPKTAKEDLACFADLLRRHTLLEEEKLFPLVESLFSEEQLDAVANHVPLLRQQPPEPFPAASPPPQIHNERWIEIALAHVDTHGHEGGHILLFPHYQPEQVRLLAKRLDFTLFDFQQDVMAPLGSAADRIDLNQLDKALATVAGKRKIVAHNVEALLCVQPEDQRRAWLSAFLDTAWPNPVVLPIALYQDEVPKEHHHVCDLELEKMSQLSTAPAPPERLKYPRINDDPGS